MLTDQENDDLVKEYQREDHTLSVRKYFQTTEKQEDEKTTKSGYVFAYMPDNSLSDKSFYGAKNVQSGKLGNIIFIPAVSKVDEHAKLSGPSALRDLLTDILTVVSEESEAYRKLREQFNTFAGSIKGE